MGDEGADPGELDCAVLGTCPEATDPDPTEPDPTEPDPTSDAGTQPARSDAGSADAGRTSPDAGRLDAGAPPPPSPFVVGARLLVRTWTYLRTAASSTASAVTTVDPHGGVSDGSHGAGMPKGMLPPAQVVTLASATKVNGFWKVKMPAPTRRPSTAPTTRRG